MVNKICMICKREYSVKKYCALLSKYCSNKCRFLSYKTSDIHMVCKNCKQPFIRKSHEIKLSKKGSYCSVKCYKSRSPQVLVKCECGKEFSAYASRVKYYGKLFCSNKCKHKFQLTGTLTELPIKNNQYQKFVAKMRHTAKYLLWKKSCLQRDGFKCSKCSNQIGLTVHHKFQMLDFVKKHGLNRDKIENDPLFLNLSNGVTFCRSCHLFNHHKQNI